MLFNCLFQTLWLGAGNLLQQIDISDIPALSSTVRACSRRVTVVSYRQPAVSLCSHCCAVSVWLLPVATDPTSYPVTHTWRCQDYCSGVYCLSFGLVQLASVWCAREPAEEDAVSTERCCSSTHQRTQMWAHHSTVTSVTLAASPETSGVQDCVLYTSR